jgi:hypothetical protein
VNDKFCIRRLLATFIFFITDTIKYSLPRV